VAGLAPAAPGYRRLLVYPRPTPELTSAAATHLTPYGKASVSWHRSADHLRLDVHVPVGASAEVHVPGQEQPVTVGHGDHRWLVADPVPRSAGAVTDV